MVVSSTILNRLKKVKIAVIGDMILDSYTIGNAKRVSPEAPVLVVNAKKQEYRPGGAGNVALNLLSLGASVVIIGRLGSDWAGKVVKQALEEEGAFTRLLVEEENYSTPVKNRIIADNQQIVRIDNEEIRQISEPLEQLIIDNLEEALEGVQAIAISDYGKGLLSNTLLQAIFSFAEKNQIKVITDPKGNEFSKYRGTTLIKPNLSEAFTAANLPRTASLESVATSILTQTQAKLLMITRSEEGISIFSKEGSRQDFPVEAKNVKDVTGAGDSVLAMLAFSLANDFTYSEAAYLCNIAGAIAIEQVGCAKITLSTIAWRLLEKDGKQKVFDYAHCFLIEELIKNKVFDIILIDPEILFSINFLKQIQNLHQKEKKTFLYIPLDQEEMIEVFSSFREVDFILTDFRMVEMMSKWQNFDCLFAYNKEESGFIKVSFDEAL